MKDRVMKAIEDNELYDFIAENYWKMEKEELKDILLEALWTGYQDAPRDEDFNRELASNLSERWEG